MRPSLRFGNFRSAMISLIRVGKLVMVKYLVSSSINGPLSDWMNDLSVMTRGPTITAVMTELTGKWWRDLGSPAAGMLLPTMTSNQPSPRF